MLPAAARVEGRERESPRERDKGSDKENRGGKT
jgi:hypothetical protein